VRQGFFRQFSVGDVAAADPRAERLAVGIENRLPGEGEPALATLLVLAAEIHVFPVAAPQGTDEACTECRPVLLGDQDGDEIGHRQHRLRRISGDLLDRGIHPEILAVRSEPGLPIYRVVGDGLESLRALLQGILGT
jgi:hypothetical protein